MLEESRTECRRSQNPANLNQGFPKRNRIGWEKPWKEDEGSGEEKTAKEAAKGQEDLRSRKQETQFEHEARGAINGHHSKSPAWHEIHEVVTEGTQQQENRNRTRNTEKYTNPWIIGGEGKATEKRARRKISRKHRGHEDHQGRPRVGTEGAPWDEEVRAGTRGFLNPKSPEFQKRVHQHKENIRWDEERPPRFLMPI